MRTPRGQYRPGRAALTLLTLFSLLAGVLTAAGPRAAVVGATGLPGHFGIGVSAEPDSTGLDGWMPNSGIAWDYAYQYLSGGVNTGSGWETWNEKAQFALWYAQS